MEYKEFKITHSDNLLEKAKEIYIYIETHACYNVYATLFNCHSLIINYSEDYFRMGREVYEAVSKARREIIEEILNSMKDRVSKKDIYLQTEGKIAIRIQILTIYTNIRVEVTGTSYDALRGNFYVVNSGSDKDFHLYLYDRALYAKYRTFVGHLKLLSKFEGYRLPPRNSSTASFYSNYDDLEYDIFGNLLIITCPCNDLVLICTKNNYTILDGEGIDIYPTQTLFDYVLEILDNGDEVDLPDNINEEIEKHRILYDL